MYHISRKIKEAGNYIYISQLLQRKPKIFERSKKT